MIRSGLAMVLIVACAAGAAAGEVARNSLWPAIPKATGAPHPEGNAWWRQNHMKLLRHDRDLTVHEGDRQIVASLKGCFECHAVRAGDGVPVTYESEEHFCRVCHDYAAVKVDCFSCHRSTPEGVDEGAAHAASGLLPWLDGAVDAAGIEAYLSTPAMAEAGQ